MLAAEVVDPPRRRVAADAAQLHIDDAASAQRDGRAGMLLGVNALVEADRGLQFPLQLGVAVDIVPAERLLDHHQVVSFQLLAAAPHRRACMRNSRPPSGEFAGKRWRKRATGCDVVARLDLDLDALVAGGQFPFHGALELVVVS